MSGQKNQSSNQWPIGVREFLSSVEWLFAKTYASTWPHEYIVKDHVDPVMFEKVVSHIRDHGYAGRFYRRMITYFEEGGLVYWTMVPPADHPDWYPVEKETIVNRCPKESTYEYRLEYGRLP